METTEIIVAIYQAYRPGTPGVHGPEGLKQYVGVAGVSGINTRPEFNSVEYHISAEEGGIRVEHEVGGLGSDPWRKRVTIELPDGVHDGQFKFANCNMLGLYSDRSANDGMGPIVDVFCRKTPIVDGSWEEAIDAAIASGIALSVPSKSGRRDEIPVKVVSVSKIYGDRFAD